MHDTPGCTIADTYAIVSHPSVEFYSLTPKQMLASKPKNKPSQICTSNNRYWPLLPFPIPIQRYRYLLVRQYSAKNPLNTNSQLPAKILQQPLLIRPRLRQTVDKPPRFLSTSGGQRRVHRIMVEHQAAIYVLRKVDYARSVW